MKYANSVLPNADFTKAFGDLIDSHAPGYGLDQMFYKSPDIYRLEMDEVLLRRWHCAGHESSIKAAGDYFLFEIDTESVIVIRGEDQKVRALMNVCRHRGSRVCDKQSGHARGGVLVCPYHAWVYKSDGSFKNARMLPSTFDASGHGLKEVQCRVVEGLIFVALADDALDLQEAEDMLHATAAPLGWKNAKVIAEARYSIDANWKLALENQVECYHCGPSHPEFSVLHSQGRKDTDDITAATIEKLGGIPVIPPRDLWALKELPGQESTFAGRFAMFNGAMTASEGGVPVAPLMGPASAYDGLFTIFYVGPLNHFLAYADYGAIFRYTPRSVGTTDFHVTWLVRGDAEEGRDYDPEKVSWLWRVTAAADKRIVEENQIGVNSRFYEPGPYIEPIEGKTRGMIDWYLQQMAVALRATA
jgi:phenylpropionate dioxygenase-like ring-hydroxylating dioxygenase large terminal subunit